MYLSQRIITSELERQAKIEDDFVDENEIRIDEGANQRIQSESIPSDEII